MEKIRYYIEKGKEITQIYKIETALIALSLCVAIISAAVLLTTLHTTSSFASADQILVEHGDDLAEQDPITVDIAGAVKKPGVYQLPGGARLKDALTKANGLSNDVDFLYFSRNVNMARLIEDQEKIYIPSKYDSQLDALSPSRTPNSTASSLKVNLNTAEGDTIEGLPGIGPTLSNKIIEARPYTQVEELLMRKIVPQSTYDKIKDYIGV